MDRQPLAHSARPLPPGVQEHQPEETLRVGLYLRPRSPLDEEELMAEGARPPLLRSPRSRASLDEAHGAEPSDLAFVEAFAARHGLRVVDSHPGRRKVLLEGTARALGEAFGIAWGRLEHAGAQHRVPVGHLHLPSEWAHRVAGVLGLDSRPHMRPHVHHPFASTAAPSAGLAVPEFAKVYRFPEGTGKGLRVGLVELDGGYTRADIEGFFRELGLEPPAIHDVGVGGAANLPVPPESLLDPKPTAGRMEVTLDLQVLGALLPEAEFAVYFAENTDQGFADAVQAALHDPAGAPSLLSISWGSPEETWSERDLELFSDLLKEAAAQGMTVLASSGDTGSRDEVDDGKAHVNFPASSPWVLGCGGTTLTLEGPEATERVWNNAPAPQATGGGVSGRFPLPPFQAAGEVPPSANDGQIRRAVPDVAANADLHPGYRVLVDGTWMGLGGTSAVAPLWAALLGRCNAALGRPCGFLTPFLYRDPEARAALHPVTQGNNGAYFATGGYSACTGLGTPDGARLLEALRKSPVGPATT